MVAEDGIDRTVEGCQRLDEVLGALGVVTDIVAGQDEDVGVRGSDLSQCPR